MPRAFCFGLFLLITLACHRSTPEVASHDKSKRESLSMIQIMTSQGMVSFEVELAKTPAERTTGLMYREALPLAQGMLFIFDEVADHSFWMKNTYIPLDLVFFDQKWFVVGVLENLEPLSTTSRSIRMNSRYVLEINAGLIKTKGIAIGNPAVLVDKDKN